MAQHQRAERSGTKGDVDMLPVVPLHISVSVRDSAPGSSGPPKSDPLTFVLAAHLLQQMVDARASKHVENFASTASIDM
jgi:hypothetical protein